MIPSRAERVRSQQELAAAASDSTRSMVNPFEDRMRMLVLLLSSNRPVSISQRAKAMEVLDSSQVQPSHVVILVANASQPTEYQYAHPILSVRAQDDFLHLAEKMVRGLRWCNQHKEFDILVKIDEDTRFCATQMPRLNPQEYVYAGLFVNKKPVVTSSLRAQWPWAHKIAALARCQYDDQEFISCDGNVWERGK